ncbi:hypothetical protein Aduo_002931 [Ancylostoma duodenale]
MIWLQFAIVLGAAAGSLPLVTIQSECTQPTPQKNESLPEKLKKFPETYKVSGVISSLTNKTAASIVELAKPGQLSTLISDRNASLHWISMGTDPKFLHNETSGKCSASTESPLSAYTLLSAVSKNPFSLSTLVSDLVDFSKNTQGVFRDNRFVAGVEGVRWVACVNGTNGTGNVQVEVVFAGDSDQSLKPPSPAFDNPLLLSLRIAEFGNFSDNTTVRSQLSVEFDSYSVVSADSDHMFWPPRGVICDGWKEDKIPLNVTDPFSALVQYVDEKKVQTESTVYYSPAEQMVVVSGARRGDVVPFINEQGVPAEASSVVHDFSKGYEYSLDSTRCVRLSALPNNTADVLSSPEGVLSLGPVESLLFASDLKFGHYGQLPAASGRMMDMYRAVDTKTNDVVEALFDGNKLTSYATYKLVNGLPVLSSYMRLAEVPSEVVPSLHGRIRSCFTQSSSAFNENNTFTFEVKSKSVKDVYSYGVETVSSALASALAQVAPINPFRVRVFYDTGADKSLRVFFSIDEKTDVKPSVVPKYNYTEEVSSSALLEKLNTTISQGDWKFSVPTADKKQEEWIVAAKSLSRYAPPAPSGSTYSGYTGGAMFVLGIFALLLGVAIGAGSVFFITKRQRISTLAYQVFE